MLSSVDFGWLPTFSSGAFFNSLAFYVLMKINEGKEWSGNSKYKSDGIRLECRLRAGEIEYKVEAIVWLAGIRWSLIRQLEIYKTLQTRETLNWKIPFSIERPANFWVSSLTILVVSRTNLVTILFSTPCTWKQWNVFSCVTSTFPWNWKSNNNKPRRKNFHINQLEFLLASLIGEREKESCRERKSFKVYLLAIVSRITFDQGDASLNSFLVRKTGCKNPRQFLCDGKVIDAELFFLSFFSLSVKYFLLTFDGWGWMLFRCDVGFSLQASKEVSMMRFRD